MPTTYQVVLLTARHSISGEITLQDQRLSDFLNDRRETTMRLTNTQVARLSDPSKVIQRNAEAVIPKSLIAVAFEPPQHAIPSSKRLFGYVHKQQHEVFLVLEGLEVHGILHTTGELDLRRYLAINADSFLPITRATVYLDVSDRYVIEQDAILVNARWIRYIAPKASAVAPSSD
ncbi:MAG: hypothetical protein N2559_03735 [Anaerolineae bacterium]|nr:hypothetical protein [Anaerolineae bacterium]